MEKIDTDNSLQANILYEASNGGEKQNKIIIIIILIIFG